MGDLGVRGARSSGRRDRPRGADHEPQDPSRHGRGADLANHRFTVRLYLTAGDGQPVDLGEGPIEAATHIEVGRPPGLEVGTPLDATLALNAGALPLAPGSYVLELQMDEVVRARTPFRVRTQHDAQSPARAETGLESPVIATDRRGLKPRPRMAA